MICGSLQSELRLRFDVDAERGLTRLVERKAGGLAHVGKPFRDGEVLVLQLVNPTAGLFSGDELVMRVQLEAGAKVALTSPSAARFHTMEAGRAELRQEFELGEGAWLDFWPEMMIPQRASETRQTTVLRLAKGARAVFLDSLAPGRVAHGENGEFRRLETGFELWREGELLVKERGVISPQRGMWPLEVTGWERCYYGALWVVDEAAGDLAGVEKCAAGFQPAVFAGQRAGSPLHEVLCGWSLLEPGVGVLRVLAPGSLALRRALAAARADLQKKVPLLATDFRKL